MLSSTPSAAPRTLDVLSVAGFGALFLWGALRVDATIAGQDWLWLGLGSLAGVLGADLATGLVHALGDRCFREDTPWIGEVLIQPFREHHVDPQAITRHGFFQVTGNNALVALPVSLAFAVGAPALGSSPGSTFGLCFLASFGLVAVASNMFHRWAHMGEVPRLVGRLQRAGIILSPRHHGRHHRAPHDRNYCVATGWMNPVVDHLGWLRARMGPAAGSPRTPEESTLGQS